MQINDQITLRSPQDTMALAQRLAAHIRAGDVILLDGELGAGKTFFAAALIHALGVPEQLPVTSPTFTLLQHYTGTHPIYHADAYRLDRAEELLTLGLQEAIDHDAVVIVEWGSRLAPSLRTGWLGITFEFLDDSARRVQLSAAGERGQQLAHLAASERLW